tara:strand:- start:16776 stop:18707 length:1932 start_codon:yes stop_codon:yes gene_type:complete
MKHGSQGSAPIELLKVSMVSVVFLAIAFWWFQEERPNPPSVTPSTDARDRITPKLVQSSPVEKESPNTGPDEVFFPVDVPKKNAAALSPDNKQSSKQVPAAIKTTDEKGSKPPIAELVDSAIEDAEPTNQKRSARLKIPIPSQSEIDTASEVVKEVYSTQLAEAKSALKKNELARQMAVVAADTDELASRFVLLRSAKNIAISTGDVVHAMEFVNTLIHNFDVDAFSMRTDCLIRVSQLLTSPEQNRAYGEATLSVVDEMVDHDLYAGSDKLLRLAHSAALKSRDIELIKAIVAKKGLVKRYLSEYESIRSSFQALETNPGDSVAAGKVGQFYCFVRGLWGRGIPLLAASDLESLREIASLELANPSAAAQRVALADQWWELAETYADPSVADTVRQHACLWYSRAVSSLTGLEQVRVKKRLESQSLAQESFVKDKDDNEIVAVLMHSRAGAANESVTLYRSGLFTSPVRSKALSRQTWWTVQRNLLVMIYPNAASSVGYGVDVGMLDDDGRSYSGRSQDGNSCKGKVTRGSADWNQMRNTHPLADEKPSASVAGVWYKSSKMKRYLQKRLLAGGTIWRVGSASRWVIANDLIIMVYPGSNFAIDYLKVSADGTLVGRNQQGIELKGQVKNPTQLFNKLINSR